MVIEPKITRFYTRSEIKMRSPRKVSYAMKADNGCTVHYGGGGPNPAPTTVAACMALWRQWQNFHMDGQGWHDIAYTAGFDNEGNVYAGRGLGVRCGANGTSFANEHSYGFVWLGGGSAKPSAKALAALLWLIQNARSKGGASSKVQPHRKWVKTDCCGHGFDALISTYNGQSISAPSKPSAPANPYTVANPRFPLPTGHWYGLDDKTPYSHSGVRAGDRDEIRKIQSALNNGYLKQKGWDRLTVDGKFGPHTSRIVRLWQRDNQSRLADHKVNGKFGRNSWNVLF